MAEYVFTLRNVRKAHGDKVEITSGLSAGQKIIGRGAILLKPLVVQAKTT